MKKNCLCLINDHQPTHC